MRVWGFPLKPLLSPGEEFFQGLPGKGRQFLVWAISIKKLRVLPERNFKPSEVREEGPLNADAFLCWYFHLLYQSVAHFRLAMWNFYGQYAGQVLTSSWKVQQGCSTAPTPHPCCSGCVQPHREPSTVISFPSPVSPCPSLFREPQLHYAEPLSSPHALACHATERAQEAPKQGCHAALAL